MNVHFEIISLRLHPVHKRSHHMYILAEIPQGLQHHRDVAYWGPPGFWHWISYQLLYPGQPTAWGSPLSAVAWSTLLNVWSRFIHSQEESLRPDTSSSPWNQNRQHKDDFPGSRLTWSFSLCSHTPSPFSSPMVTNHILFGAFDSWEFK